MEIYLKKYFWVLQALVIAICAVLAAKGVNHLVEAKYLLGDAKAKPSTRARALKPAAAAKPVDTKDEGSVMARNIFCSTCEPPQPVAGTGTEPTPVTDPNSPPITSLPLALLVTHVASDEVFSSATITNTSTARSGSYWLHEAIPDAGEIVAIRPRYVDFHNKQANRVERLDLLGAAAPQPKPATPAPATPAPAKGADADLVAEIDKGVRKIDDTHYEIDRSLVDKLLSDPSLIARSARIVPSIKDGKANGFKMYAIRPNSVYAKIGLQNGDTIHSINGFEITSPDKALEVYTKVKSASSLSIQITRRGQTVTMEYTIK